MTQIGKTPFDRSRIEMLLRENKFAEALALLHQSAARAPLEREISLYILLSKVRLHGPEYYERDIDALRALTDLNDHEKATIRRIFLYAFQIAEKAGEEEKKLAYQRLLRRLLLGQPLTQPIPTTSTSLLGRRIIVLESAAIVSTPFHKSKETRRANIGPRPKAARRAALGFGALCLLMMPWPYLVSRVAPASNYRPDAMPTQANPVAVATTADSQNHGPRTEVDEIPEEAQVKESLEKQLSGLRRAYARWSGKKRDISGSVWLKLTLDREGKVVTVNEISSEFPDADFIKTVVAEARKWRLPMTRATASEITIPLLFMPKGAEAPSIAEWQGASSSKSGRSGENSESISLAAVRSEAAGAQETIATNRHDVGKQSEPLSLDYVAQRMVALRQEPRFASSTLEEILPGTRMSVIAVEGDWLKVRSARSRIAGFVRKEFVVPDVLGR